MKKNLAALIISIVVLVLTLVSFFGVWYGSHYSIIISSSSMNSYDSLNFLTEGKVVLKDLKTGTSTSNTYNYNDIKHFVDYYDIPGYVPSIFVIYNNTFYFMMIIVLISVLALICYLLLFIPIVNNILISKVGVGFSLLLVIVSIFTICYFAIHYTLIQNESIERLISGSNLAGLVGFWSDASYTEPITKVSLHINSGPGYAWYLTIFIAILSIIIYGIIRKKLLEELSIDNLEDRVEEGYKEKEG